MTDWTNPYADIQQEYRSALLNRLRRTNGRVSREDFMACAMPGQAAKAERSILRVLLELPDGALEWKPEIVSEAALLAKLGGGPAFCAEQLLDLWARSRALEARTAYPALAPAGKKGQLVSRHSSEAAPVFGVDILIRPPIEFADTRAGGVLRHNLSLGRECVALIVHAEFVDGRLSDHGDYFVRVVVGDDLAVPEVLAMLDSTALRCELAMIEPLYTGDAPTAVDAALLHLDRLAQRAAATLSA